MLTSANIINAIRLGKTVHFRMNNFAWTKYEGIWQDAATEDLISNEYPQKYEWCIGELPIEVNAEAEEAILIAIQKSLESKSKTVDSWYTSEYEVAVEFYQELLNNLNLDKNKL